jgi:hypothetical protein
MNKKFIWIIGIFLLLVIGFFFLGGNLTGNIVSAEDIKIPLSDISSQTKFYETDGIRFFVVKAGDGSIKTAFDACDVCYSANKGYRQEVNYMVCNNCGNKYPLSGLGTENKAGGGCWPGYLPSEILEESLVIKNSNLKKGEYRFK